MADTLEKLAGDFPMTITERALEYLAQGLKEEQEGRKAGEYIPQGILIGVMGGGCSGFQYNVRFVESDDDIDEEFFSTEQKGVKFYMDMMSAQYLKGTELDYSQTLQGAGLVFKNPNAKRTCGCGSSFSG